MIPESFWRSAPKMFVDDASIAVMGGTGNLFLLGLMSGGNGQVFAFTPEHMKRFSQLVLHNVKMYEDQNGPIKVADWTPQAPAPFQVKDFKK